MSRPLRGVAIGAGYFSQFHYDAWQRVAGAELVALCDLDTERAAATAARHSIARSYDDVAAMLDAEQPDFLDIITPPQTHAPLVAMAGQRGIAVLCQKPLAPTLAEARAIVAQAEAAGIVFMAHDNFRFQPWHRELRRLIDSGRIGAVQAIGCRTRMGDGHGEDAYLARQPYFRDMPQFLIHETGVHFIDVYRYLGGEIAEVMAWVDRLNPVIAGEDRAMLLMRFESGARGVWDADRYHRQSTHDPRLTFGQFTVEGSEGVLRVEDDASIRFLSLDGAEEPCPYAWSRAGFAGDSVFAVIDHFVAAVARRTPHELSGADYLRTLCVQESAYVSARTGQWETVQN